MYSRIRNILRVTGIILFTTALCIVPSLIVALLYHEYVSAKAFSCTLGFCLVGGLLLMKFFPTTGIRPKKREGYLIVYEPYAELYHYESKSRGLETLTIWELPPETRRQR